MNLSDLKKDYDAFSGKASDVTRQLSFAGIAVIWVLRGSDRSSEIALSILLLCSLGGFVFTLMLDLAQYLYGTWSTGAYLHEKEKALGPNSRRAFSWPREKIKPTIRFFWGKAFFVVVSYLFLFGHIVAAITLR
ncbi:MAG: hypothetical protein KF776_15170 [Burkholderiales bacterium]|nr:hypothetical protein [Burkholderiales bacterium]